ncbi:MAG TPA: hypothetical protein DEW35_01060 [Ruminococcaceae bacterium]|nr:hypothetical protein [Oscillospiraceae bacterium]
MRKLSTIKNFLFPKMKDGTKPKAILMLYGFFGNNLGDDIFMDILLKRYPDTLFYVLFTAEYERFFEKYNNVRYYSYSRPLVDKINRFGRKHENDMLFEEILLKRSDGAVHIGGSVYQQIGNWENDLSVRKRRHIYAKHFFGITNNFGPFFSEDYKLFWKEQFKKFDSVTFRDMYSYNSFKELSNVSYAPDLLFSLEKPEVEQKKNSVAISVINPREEFRKIDKKLADNYIAALSNLTALLVKDGYSVKLLGFCNLENDTATINEIANSLEDNLKKNVEVIPYNNDFSNTVEHIASSEYIVATRFHASVLGFAFSKKVLPVSYNVKIKNMLSDLGVDTYIDFEKAGEYSAEDLKRLLLSLSPFNGSEQKEKARRHFGALDKFIKTKKGKINEQKS